MSTTRVSRAFGVALRELRKAQGLSQTELGTKARVHRNYVSLVESGTNTPTLEVIVRLAKGLKMPVITLMAEFDKKLSR